MVLTYVYNLTVDMTNADKTISELFNLVENQCKLKGSDNDKNTFMALLHT